MPEPTDSRDEIDALKRAIDRNDIDAVRALMTRNPALHRAPMGYGNNGPLTWVAECRVPWEPPAPERLAIAEWMIDNGSDIHQGGDGPLMRAALRGDRVPMMDLLVARGANVNACWNGFFPILFAPCESVDPAAIRWLLDHGADPNCPNHPAGETALDYLIGTYVRSLQLPACIDLLAGAGAATRYDLPGVLAILRRRPDLLAAELDAAPDLVGRRYPQLDFGCTGGRRLSLRGATLLHVAAEFGDVESARLLLDRGASPDARAATDEQGVGGQTPIFHAATQFGDWGLETTRLLLERGAGLSLRVKLPGHYERPQEFVECTVLEYASRFPGADFPGANEQTLSLLQQQAGIA